MSDDDAKIGAAMTAIASVLKLLTAHQRAIVVQATINVQRELGGVGADRTAPPSKRVAA